LIKIWKGLLHVLFFFICNFLHSACADINRRFFGGSPVFHSKANGTIFLNVESIPRVEPYPSATAVVVTQPYSSETVSSPMYTPPQPSVPVSATATIVEEDYPPVKHDVSASAPAPPPFSPQVGQVSSEL
jgi:hypothetical protein